MTAQPAGPARILIAGSSGVALGLLVALVTVLGMAVVRPVLLAFALGGIALLLPTFMMRDARAYWLFLLVLSIPFDISKNTTGWLVEQWTLLEEFGPPSSSVTSLDFYVTDVVLFAMLLPWLAELCVRRTTLYFPKIGYIYILYLVWAMIISLIGAPSLYLAIFEWCREALYFLSFVYLINNIVTRSQLRAVVGALLLGLVIETGTVITLFELDIGTESFLFSGIYGEHKDVPKAFNTQSSLYAEGSGESRTKRAVGTFGAPVLAAYYLEFILPVVLAYLIAAQRLREAILFAAVFGAGCAALYLTFSRSALVGLGAGSVVLFLVARWSGLISRKRFARGVLIFALFAAVAAPLVISSIEARSGTASRRLELIELALDAYWQQPFLPIFGGGLNNSTVVIKEGTQLTDKGRQATAQSIHSHYVVVVTEVGLVGFLLLYVFFGKIVMIALRSISVGEAEIKPLLVGIIGGLAGVAVHNLGDGLAGHATNTILWLYAALIIVTARRPRAERALPLPLIAREVPPP